MSLIIFIRIPWYISHKSSAKLLIYTNDKKNYCRLLVFVSSVIDIVVYNADDTMMHSYIVIIILFGHLPFISYHTFLLYPFIIRYRRICSANILAVIYEQSYVSKCENAYYSFLYICVLARGATTSRSINIKILILLIIFLLG